MDPGDRSQLVRELQRGLHLLRVAHRVHHRARPGGRRRQIAQRCLPPARRRRSDQTAPAAPQAADLAHLPAALNVVALASGAPERTPREHLQPPLGGQRLSVCRGLATRGRLQRCLRRLFCSLSDVITALCRLNTSRLAPAPDTTRRTAQNVTQRTCRSSTRLRHPAADATETRLAAHTSTTAVPSDKRAACAHSAPSAWYARAVRTALAAHPYRATSSSIFRSRAMKAGIVDHSC